MGTMGTRLRLSKEYTIEELFELIKDVEFEAGKPSIANHGPTKWIVFPEISRYNQVVIGGSQGKFYAKCISQPIVVNTLISKRIITGIIKILAGFSGNFEKIKKRYEKLAESVGIQINNMNL